jgi:hypothetical protein
VQRHPYTIHPDVKWMENKMAANFQDLRPTKPPETEKITINLGYVDLGHVDLMKPVFVPKVDLKPLIEKVSVRFAAKQATPTPVAVPAGSPIGAWSRSVQEYYLGQCRNQKRASFANAAHF